MTVQITVIVDRVPDAIAIPAQASVLEIGPDRGLCLEWLRISGARHSN